MAFAQGARFTDEKLSRLKLAKVTMLELSDTSVTDAGLISALGKTNRLCDLLLTSELLTNDCTKAIGEVETLETLNIEIPNIDDRGVSNFRNSRLCTVVLENMTGVTNASVESLARNPRTVSFGFDGASVDDGAFEQLRHCERTVGMLSFRDTKVTGMTVPVVAGCVRRLDLYLAGCPVTDEAVKGLAKLDIKTLELCRTMVTDRCLLYLMGCALDELRLSNTQVSDEGLPLLRDHPTLQWVWLKETNVTEQGKEWLRAAKGKGFVSSAQ